MKLFSHTGNGASRICRYCRAALVLLCLFCPLGLAAVPDAAEIEQLLPTNDLWQFYPTYVKSVKFDNTGRPWFIINKGGPRPSIEKVKQSVENAWGLRAPWVIGAKIVLFDRSGRIWLIPNSNTRLLLGYHPASRQWIERQSFPQPYGKPAGGSEAKHPHFLGPAHESKSDRLYFADRMGVHVFYNGNWTYEFLYKQNFEQDRFYDDIKAFNDVSFAEDASSRVYVWSTWGRFGWTGTIGYFLHENGTWKHVENIAGTLIERLNAVVPLSNDQVLAFQYNAPAVLHNIARAGPMVLNLPDGETRHFAFVPSEARTEIDGHILTGARHLCSQRDGTAWIRASHCTTPDEKTFRDNIWRVSPDGRVLGRVPEAEGWYPDSAYVDTWGLVFFARYEKGCVVFDKGKMYPVTDKTQEDYRWLLGEDSTGRIYIAGPAGVAACAFQGPERRPALPTTIYEVPHRENVVCLDSYGRIWAKLAGPEHLFLSVFANGRWVDYPMPGQWFDDPTANQLKYVDHITYIQPLCEGWVVAQHRPRSTAFLFDGDNWTAFKDMQQLIESRFVDIATRIDNARFGRDFYTKMRIDNAGRIWLVEWTRCGVYDGRKWLDVVSAARKQGFGTDQFHHCLPLDNGTRMLLSHSLMAWVEHGQLKMGLFDPKVRMGKIESDYTTRSGLWLDSTSRVWLPMNSKSCSVLTNLDDIQLISDSGYPRFEDSAGCIWFLNDRDKQLVVRNRNGATLSLHEDALHATSAVVEDRPGSVWISTVRGLLHVVKETGNREIGFSLRKVKHYQREVPNGSCLEMFVDSERNLWFYGPGPDNYRLYRVQLPDK